MQGQMGSNFHAHTHTKKKKKNYQFHYNHTIKFPMKHNKKEYYHMLLWNEVYIYAPNRKGQRKRKILYIISIKQIIFIEA